MAYENEFMAMQGSAMAQIREMTDEQLQKYASLMVSRGTPSAGIRAYGISDILGGSAKLQAAERAKYDVMGLEFGEKKRQFGEEMGYKKDVLGFEKRKHAEEMTMFETQLKDLRDARKKQQKNWWQKYLGTAVGTGLGMLIPGVGSVIGAGIGGLFSEGGAFGKSDDPYDIMARETDYFK